MNLNRISQFLYQNEDQAVDAALSELNWSQERARQVTDKTVELISQIRTHKRKPGELDSFMQQYGLNTDEGIALMTLAEALLRVPDAPTANILIRDKITAANWLSQQGRSRDWMVKAAGYGLSISKMTYESLLSKLGEPVIRQATLQAMRILGHQFVLGRDIDEAIERGSKDRGKQYRFSYDMLGEGARTYEDAEKYFSAYKTALSRLAERNESIGTGRGERLHRAGISVKLSALHPRYEYSKAAQCVPVLVERVQALGRIAKQAGLNLTIDAEESERLEISLEVFERLCADQDLTGWNGLGLAVQAYQKRCLALIEHLRKLALKYERKIQIRLVKGAYWDSEIKQAQIESYPDFPVFTRKVNTDLNFLAAAHKLLSNRDVFYPMLATHNAHSVISCLEFAKNDEGNIPDNFEFQRLHGMGEALYESLKSGHEDLAVSIYAPVGTHKDLLPYLVRRLLENGANSSFVNKIADLSIPPADIVQDPVKIVRERKDGHSHPAIRHPRQLFGQERKNSIGIDLNDESSVRALMEHMQNHIYNRHFDLSTVLPSCAKNAQSQIMASLNPADDIDKLADIPVFNDQKIDEAFTEISAAWAQWNEMPAHSRADILDKIADLYEEHLHSLIGIIVREGGRSMHDALMEVREAVDFCRYYACQARDLFTPQSLPGPTGELNELHVAGRGIFICVSPWNFPLAIFTGQVVAALVTGNAVLAKPAEQTPVTAALAIKLMYQAGVPKNILRLITGDGEVGAKLISHEAVDGVVFTGSLETAKKIYQTLASKSGAIPAFIAETGGQNAMIIDSTALPEQVIDDLLTSAFYSAGQRCSATRIACIQDDVADKILEMLKGAMATLKVGDTREIDTDIGPIIDKDAIESLEMHCHAMERHGKRIAKAPMDPEYRKKGCFLAPCVYEISCLKDLTEEHFGPVLHILRYKAEDLDGLIQTLNEMGYGLTFGIHSRIESRYEDVIKRIRAGNCYVNRSMTGAVVGVQPFGGRGLSGTGPKAGGPHYLPAFTTEKAVCINTSAIGGNASLVGLLDEE